MLRCLSRSREYHQDDVVQGSNARKFLWFIPLAPNTHPLQFFAFLLAVFVAMTIVVYTSASQAVIISTMLHISDSSGDVTGSLALYGEIVALAMVVFWGTISDRIQKRTVYCFSLLLMGLAVCLYPQVKSLYPGLLLLKLIFAAGSAGCTTMMAAMMTDVVHGKGGLVSGLIGACSGLGAIFSAFVLFAVPAKLGVATKSPVQGVVVGWGIIGGCVLFLGITLWFCLPKSKHGPTEPIYIRVKKGIISGKDPRISLAFVTSFFARADEIIITSFISLWVNQYYIDVGQCKVGSPCYMAMGTTGAMTGIAQSVSLASAPFFGLASEYLPRPYPIIAAGLIGAAGCFPFAFSFDPTSRTSLAFVILIAVGELGMIISGMAMLNGPYVPKDLRGSISGTYSFIGAIGIIVISKIGGVLFDKWMKGAPFLLLGIGHCLVSVFAIVVLLLNRRLESRDRLREERERDQEQEQTVSAQEFESFDYPLEIKANATSELRPSGDIDLAATIDIADYIKSKKVSSKDAAKALRRRLTHTNPNVVLLALHLSDFCVQNGGKPFVNEVATNDLINVIKNISNDKASDNATRAKAKELIQVWGLAARNDAKLSNFTNTYQEMKSSDIEFPPEPQNLTALYFESAGAPEWTESSVCERCRTPFSLTNRKHHCRRCGGTFCQLCSSKRMRLPQLGINEPVRICDSCYTEVKLKESSKDNIKTVNSRNQHTPTDSGAEELDEDLKRALQLSIEESNQVLTARATEKADAEEMQQRSPGLDKIPRSQDGADFNDHHQDILEQVEQLCRIMNSKSDAGVHEPESPQFQYDLDQMQRRLVEGLQFSSNKQQSAMGLHDRIQWALQTYDHLLESRIHSLHSNGHSAELYKPTNTQPSIEDELFADATAPDFSMADQAIIEDEARVNNDQNHMQYNAPPVVQHQFHGTYVTQGNVNAPVPTKSQDMPLIDLSD